MENPHEKRVPENKIIRSHPGLKNPVYLACIVALASIIYLPRLGFYSDDLDFVDRFGALSTETKTQFVLDSIDYPFGPRPLHGIYSAILVSAFGDDPLPYHLVNFGLLLASTVILYFLLEKIQSRGQSHFPSRRFTACYRKSRPCEYGSPQIAQH
jgi:hypothetical protein